MTTNLVSMVYKKDIVAINEALKGGADIDTLDADSRTPLMHAILDSESDIKLIDFLLKNGSNVDYQEPIQGWTPLHFAARDQKTDIVELLLKHRAAVDPVDSFGNTPLWRALTNFKNQFDLINILLAAGADADKKNNSNISPRDYAERMGRNDIVALLGKKTQKKF